MSSLVVLPRPSSHVRAATLLWSAVAGLGVQAAGQSTERVNTSSSGEQASIGDGGNVSLSGDARFACFTSAAPNLVADDTNGASDVFVKDRATGETTRVSVGAGGAQGNGLSFQACISGNGRFVAFASDASNLVAGDTNGARDVFVRDRVAQTTERVSVTATGSQGDARSGIQFPLRSISSDGRFVVFDSWATNFVVPDLNNGPDLFLKDRATGALALVGVTSGGQQVAGWFSAGSVSDDGVYIAFVSDSPYLVTGDTNGIFDVFVRDRSNGTTRRINVGPGGVEATYTCDNVQISGNGLHVVFESFAPNLVSGDTNGEIDVFHCFVPTGALERASVTASGAQLPRGGTGGRTTDYGESVFFQSPSPADGLGTFGGGVFRRGIATGLVERLSYTDQGAPIDGANDVGLLAASGDSESAAFRSNYPFVVSGGDAYPGYDLYLRQHAFTGPQFCLSDEFDAPCPCGNDAVYGGCAASWGGGGLLDARGLPSVAADGLVLRSRWAQPVGSCLFFQGTSPVAGGMGAPFGDGLRCVAGSVLRLTLTTGTTAESVCPAPGNPPISIQGQIPASGGTRYYQVWYRNAAAFCTSATFNLTNAVRILWVP